MANFLRVLCVLSGLLAGAFGLSENKQEVLRGGHGHLGYDHLQQ